MSREEIIRKIIIYYSEIVDLIKKYADDKRK